MAVEIQHYKNNVFTHQGQCDLTGFTAKLPLVSKQLNAVGSLRKPLIVYCGFHSHPGRGDFKSAFSKTENKVFGKIVRSFRWSIYRNLSHGPVLPEIKAALMRGNVFFAWSDSDIWINKIYELTH